MKNLKKVLAFALILFSVMLVGDVIGISPSANLVQASVKKTILNKSAMTIPVGKLKKSVYWVGKDNEYQYATSLSVKNKVKEATYTFTTGDKKIATIDKNGGYITGIKKGTTTIVCKQTYKKKVTIVGKCKITVKEPSVGKSVEGSSDLSVGTGLLNVTFEYNSEGYGIPKPYEIIYKNPDATYTFKSDSSDFVYEETKLTAEEQNYYGGLYGEPVFRYNATKPGTYSVSVIETYNKKSKTIGSFKITVHDIEVTNKVYELPLNSMMNVWEPVKYSISGKTYYFIIEGYDKTNTENNVVQLARDEDKNLVIQGLKTGTAIIKVYEDSVETGRNVGQFTVKVVEKSE